MGAIMEKRIKEFEGKKFAGFGIRLLAFILDAVVISSILNIIPRFHSENLLSNLSSNLKTSSDFSSLFYNNLQVIVQTIYSVIMLKYYGATLGKMALKIKVTEKNGQLTWVSIIIRETIGKFISGIILGIGYLMVLWNPKKQALHDKIADTYVILETS